MKVKIILAGSAKGTGLLYHLTYLAINFSSNFKNTKYSFLLLSEKNEQETGLWRLIEENLSPNEYVACNSSLDFIGVVESYLNDDHYSNVIYLTQGLKQFSNTIKLKRTFKKKLILYTRLNSFKHGTNYRKPLSFYYSFLFRRYADVVNFQCNSTIRQFSNSKIILEKGNYTVIPLGINNPEVISDPDKRKLNSIMQDDKIFKIVYLAQFHKHKRHSELINAINQYLQEKNDVKLIFLGEGIEMQNVKDQIKSADIENKVYFAGRINRKYIPFYLKNSNLSIVLSKNETFGHNILEPLFYGVPVITSDVGIASDIIKDFFNGFVLRSTDMNKLPGIVKSFENNYDKQLVKSTSNLYTWENTVIAYENLFDYLLKRTH